MPVVSNIKEIPASVVVSATAANYTVPAGYYAVVRAQVRNGGTFSIDGSVVLTSNTWNTINSNSSPHTITGGGNGGTVIPGFSTASSSTGSSGIASLPASGQGQLATGVIYNQSISFTSAATFANSTAMTAVEQQFKVPAGTVVVGAGNSSYCIELYTA